MAVREGEGVRGGDGRETRGESRDSRGAEMGAMRGMGVECWRTGKAGGGEERGTKAVRGGGEGGSKEKD